MRHARQLLPALCGLLCLAATSVAQDAPVRVGIDLSSPGRPASPLLTGVCIEDVNHEIYGGLYSQMLFGESFQEPSRRAPVPGFDAFGGRWAVRDGVLAVEAGDGPKLLAGGVTLADGEAGVDVRLDGDGADGKAAGGNAGLVVRVTRPGDGADRFTGYEVTLDARRQRAIVARHDGDFRPLGEADCDVPAGRWVRLGVTLAGPSIDVTVDGRRVLGVQDPDPLPGGTIGVRPWRRAAAYRNLTVRPAGADAPRALPFAAWPADAKPAEVSGMWTAVESRPGALTASLDTDRPFVGTQSQRIGTRDTGVTAGVANRGLNGWGLAFAAGRPYDGYVWLRAARPVRVTVAAQDDRGDRTYAKQTIDVAGDDAWRRHDLALTPDATDARGRLAILLDAPGEVVVGHALLQPGDWGRFAGLPVRRDLAGAMRRQGVSLLRYGGTMVNAPAYRWKHMIGPRDRRPPYRGHWYAHSTNGFGIVDFLNFAEALGVAAVPAFNLDETPQDMSDFVDYATAAADTPWGRQRAADGHPTPYRLTHVEIGNEERVDERYAEKFAAIAAAVWQRAPGLVLVVGDFDYKAPVRDPMHVTGAASGITSLSGQQQVLATAKRLGGEVWFDVHVWNNDAREAERNMDATLSYADALEKLAAGARHRVVVFELNATNHAQRRAVANAWAVGLAERDGRLPMVASANGLQPDGQNDNGWDQGLLFFTPSKAWLQPPGHVTQMLARTHQPRAVTPTIDGEANDVLVTAAVSDDKRTLAVRCVNRGDRAVRVRLDVTNAPSPFTTLKRWTLAAAPDARNTAADPDRVVPRYDEQRVRMPVEIELAPTSVTAVELR